MFRRVSQQLPFQLRCCVNKKSVKLRGGCIHHDNGVLGACEFVDAAERKIRILKEQGYNAIRSAHNPCSEEILEACDKYGMYVIDEAFDGWYIPKTYHDYARVFKHHYAADLKAMAQKDKNHPCVISYSIGNEVTETAEERGIKLTEEMVQILHEADSTRPVICGINPMLNWLVKRGMRLYRENSVYLPEQLLPKEEKQKEQKAGSAFFNMLMQKASAMTQWIAKSDGAGKAIRSSAENLDILGLNYGSSRYEKEVNLHPEQLIIGTESLVTELPENWKKVTKYPNIIGDFCWTAWDYLGESGIGSFCYASDTGLPLLAGCGTIDLLGVPDVENYFQRIVWGIRKEPYIAARPVWKGKEVPVCGRWRFTNAVSTWNFHGCEGQTAEVEVFANAAEVELYLNGNRIDRKQIKSYRALFHTKYEQGILKAVTYDENGNIIGKSKLLSGEHSEKLKVTADKTRFRADGQSLCFLKIELTDENGAVCPCHDCKISVETDDGIYLQGLGSSAFKTNDSYLEQDCMTYRGRTLVVIRSGYEPGIYRVRVKSEDGQENLIEITVR